MKETTLKCSPLDQDSFAPYGQYISADSRPADAAVEELSFWNRLAVMEYPGKTSVSIVQTYGRNGLTEYTLEQHSRSEETIIPTDDIYVVVGLSEASDAQRPDLSTVKAFFVPKGSAITFAKGVWHHAPLTELEQTRSFVIFQETTPDEDLLVLDLPAEYDLFFKIDR